MKTKEGMTVKKRTDAENKRLMIEQTWAGDCRLRYLIYFVERLCGRKLTEIECKELYDRAFGGMK